VDLKQSEHSYDDWVSVIEVGWLPGRVREVQVIPVHPHKFFSVRQDSKLDAIIYAGALPTLDEAVDADTVTMNVRLAPGSLVLINEDAADTSSPLKVYHCLGYRTIDD
jgi:hypothetical protein